VAHVNELDNDFVKNLLEDDTIQELWSDEDVEDMADAPTADAPTADAPTADAPTAAPRTHLNVPSDAEVRNYFARRADGFKNISRHARATSSKLVRRILARCLNMFF
jgi:hypothetical protein